MVGGKQVLSVPTVLADFYIGLVSRRSNFGTITLLAKVSQGTFPVLIQPERSRAVISHQKQ